MLPNSITDHYIYFQSDGKKYYSLYTLLSWLYAIPVDVVQDDLFPDFQWFLARHHILDAFWTHVAITHEKQIVITVPNFELLFIPFAVTAPNQYPSIHTQSKLPADRCSHLNNVQAFKCPLSWGSSDNKGWVKYWVKIWY